MAVYGLIEDESSIQWNPFEVIGVSREALSSSNGSLSLGATLQICSATNLHIFDLPCREEAAWEVSSILKEIGWRPASKLNLTTVLDGILLQMSQDSPNVMHFEDLRQTVDLSSASYIDELSKDDRLALANKLKIVEREFENAVEEQNVDLALTLHQRFHLLMQHDESHSLFAPVYQQCLQLPTLVASRSEDYFNIAKEQHARAIKIIEAKSFSTSDFSTWHRLERSFGYSSAVFNFGGGSGPFGPF